MPAPTRPETIDIKTLGEDVPLLEGIRTTRAIRRLSPEPIPRELVRKVVEAGTYGPSGGNRQPWLFVAVSDAERRAWVAGRYRTIFDAYIAPAVQAAKNPDYSAVKRRNMQSAIHLSNHLHEVPVHLFVAGYTRRGQPQTQGVFPAIQNVLLACRAVGLGACLTTLHTAAGREIDDYLGLPEGSPSCALIPIGWPLIPYKRPVRKSVDDVLHWEAYPNADALQGGR